MVPHTAHNAAQETGITGLRIRPRTVLPETLILGGPDSAGRIALFVLYSQNPYLPDTAAAELLHCSPRTIPKYRRELETAGLLAPRVRAGATAHGPRWRSAPRKGPGRYVVVPGAVLGRLLAAGVRWGDALRTWCLLVQRRITAGAGAVCALTTAELAWALQVGEPTVRKALQLLTGCDLVQALGARGRARLLRPLLALPNVQHRGERVRAAAAARFRAAGLRPPDAPARTPAPKRWVPPAPKPRVPGGAFPQASATPTRAGARPMHLADLPSGPAAADDVPRGGPPAWWQAWRSTQRHGAAAGACGPAASTVRS